MDEDFDKVFRQFQGLIHNRVQVWRGLRDYDDLYQVACLGFLKAYRAYDSSRNIKFITVAQKYIDTELVRESNRRYRGKKDIKIVSLESVYDDAKKEYYNIEDEVIDKLTVKDILMNLLPKEQKIISFTLKSYEENMQVQDIGKMFGLKPSALSQYKRRIFKKIRRMYAIAG